MSNATSASLNIWEAPKYPLWEIGLLCSNGAIYIFNLIFLCTIFWLFVVVVVVVVLGFFLKKNVFFILFFHVFFIFLFSTFLFLFLFYLFINFFDGSNGPPYSSKQYDIFHVQIIWNCSCKSTNEMLWKWNRGLALFADKTFQPYLYSFCSFYASNYDFLFLNQDFSHILFTCPDILFLVQNFPHICFFYILFWLQDFPSISFFDISFLV